LRWLAQTPVLWGLRSAQREFIEMLAWGNRAASVNGLSESQTSLSDVCATRHPRKLRTLRYQAQAPATSPSVWKTTLKSALAVSTKTPTLPITQTV